MNIKLNLLKKKYIKPEYGGPKALVFLVLIRVVSSKYIIL